MIGAVESAGAILALLGPQNVGGALVAGEEAAAVVGFEKGGERFDAVDDHEEIVLARKREHRIDEVVAGTLFAQVDL